MSNYAKATRSVLGVADDVVTKIEGLLSSIDYAPPGPTSFLSPDTPQGFLEAQLAHMDQVLKDIESVIPRRLRSIYDGIVAITDITHYDPDSWEAKGYIDAKPASTAQTLALQWMSANYDSDQFDWLVALAILRKCLAHPGADIRPMAYHGSPPGAARVDSVVKDVVLMNVYLKDRILFSTRGVRLVPEDYYYYHRRY